MRLDLYLDKETCDLTSDQMTCDLDLQGNDLLPSLQFTQSYFVQGLGPTGLGLGKVGLGLGRTGLGGLDYITDRNPT